MIKDNTDEYKIDLKKIKPKNIKKSDKYSKNIYRFLKDNERYRRVFYDKSGYENDSQHYVSKEFDVENIDINNLYFGVPCYDNPHEIIGKCLSGLVSGGQKSFEVFCYFLHRPNAELVEVTKEFYEKYMEIGRCIYGKHPSGLQDEDGRYTYLDDTHRVCNWCGKKEHLETKICSYTRNEWIED